MSRKKIIKELKIKNPGLTILEIENILDIFTESIVNALKDGQAIHLKRLGRIYLKKLKANANLRNPRTNKLIYRPERIKIRFRASKELNKKINEN
ncbi:MAG: HU family DNA-binding protein [Pseudomonadota bacterium]|nr:HU family DNA-binding protein [Pseudomonadota bacterium]